MAHRSTITGLFLVLAIPSLVAIGCSGADGAPGATGATGPAGEQGSTGPTGPAGTSNPSVSGITPGAAFLDRSVDVTISGYGTEWTDDTAVDFGPNVTVNSHKAASPTAIVANLTVGPDATLGARDVKVGDMTYAGAFKLQSPLGLNVMGTIAQGSVATIEANSLDFTTPFDTTYTGDGLFTPITYTNIQISAIPGLTTSLSTVEPYKLSMMAFIDVDTAAGAKDFDVVSGPAGNQVHFPYPGALDVTARTATAVSAGTPATGNITDAYSSALYTFTPSAGDHLLNLAVTSTSSSATPGVIILPKSGKFADMVKYAAAATLATTSTDPYYLVVWDNTGAANFDYTVKADETAVNSFAESEPNDTYQTAQTAPAFPILFKNASLSSIDDQDWLKVDVAAGDVGKSIHVVTIPGDAYTDTVVEVFASDGTTSLGGPSNDSSYHEDWLSAPTTAAGAYYVKISASSYFSSSAKNYQAIITLE